MRFHSTSTLLGLVVRGLAMLAVTLTSLANPRPAHASMVWVTSLADGAANAANCPGAGCRLRDAIAAANPGDAIHFAVNGQIFLTAGELLIDKNLDIVGQGARTTFISGNDVSRVFHFDGDISVAIFDLSIRHGYATAVGGGVYADGATVVFDGVDVYDNHVGANQTTCFLGGALALFNGTYGIVDSVILYNSMPASSCGAWGPGIYVAGSTLNLTNVTLANNQTDNDGGGYGGQGGAIFLGPSATGNLNNVSIAGNHAQTNGGGLYIHNSATALNIKNSILANNTAASGPDCSAAAPALNSQDYNLIESTSGCTIGGTTTHNITGMDPRFRFFGFGGGTTYSLSLQNDSPAIDAGNDATCADHDQRGYSRPRGPTCDIGSYEAVPPFSDFDGDWIADPIKWDSTNSAWWLRSSDAAWDGEYLGPGDYVGRSDFDGDGKTDPAKFDSGNTLWYLESGTGTLQSVYMGPGTYTPVWGSDFDGDGSSDPGHFSSTTNSLWYRSSASGMWIGLYLGPGDRSFVSSADFDADGITDPATFDGPGGSTNTLWFLQSSKGTWVGRYLGAGDYVYVEGSDFNMDAYSDPAQFTASSNTLWYQTDAFLPWQGVWMGATPLQYVPAADFDGDFITDPAGLNDATNMLWWMDGFGVWHSTDMGAGTYTIVN